MYYKSFGLSDLCITEEEINLKYAAKLYFPVVFLFIYSTNVSGGGIQYSYNFDYDAQ